MTSCIKRACGTWVLRQKSMMMYHVRANKTTTPIKFIMIKYKYQQNLHEVLYMYNHFSERSQEDTIEAGKQFAKPVSE